MLNENTKLFKALSDPNRLRILKMLQMKELCVCEIRDVLQLATSTVSKHLSVLKDAGFITESKNGKWVNYQINSEPTDSRIISIMMKLDFWIGDEEILKTDKEKVRHVDRNYLCGG